jgi:hypothetical protein
LKTKQICKTTCPNLESRESSSDQTNVIIDMCFQLASTTEDGMACDEMEESSVRVHAEEGDEAVESNSTGV